MSVKSIFIPNSPSFLAITPRLLIILIIFIISAYGVIFFQASIPHKRPVRSDDKLDKPECEAGFGNRDKDRSEMEAAAIFDPRKNRLRQDSPVLLDYIRRNHLFPPFPVPYNLVNPTGDPAAAERQHLEVLRLLKGKRNGVFIEAGANDGEFLSTTLVLERDYGWSGILVEPDSVAFSELRRKGRKSWLSNACLSVSDAPEKVKFVQNKQTSTWSKVAKISTHDRKWDPSERKEVIATCFPLYSLTSALNMTVIDYFSLDIEGAELAILKTIPFESILIRTLSIEFDHIRLVPGADEELKALMQAKGYTLVKELTGGNAKDYVYAHWSILT